MGKENTSILLVASTTGPTDRRFIQELNDVSWQNYVLTQSTADRKLFLENGTDGVVINELLDLTAAQATVLNHNTGLIISESDLCSPVRGSFGIDGGDS